PVEVVDLEGEVLAEVGRGGGLEEVDLLPGDVEPGAIDADVGAVDAHGHPQRLVEVDGGDDVGDVDLDVVDASQCHGADYGSARRRWLDRAAGRTPDWRAVSAAEIDGYLAGVGEPKRSTLQALRESILRAAPGAEQGLSY